MIKLIEPRLVECNKRKENHKLLMALMDLDIRSDDDFNCLCPEYQDILNRKDAIRATNEMDVDVADQIEGSFLIMFLRRKLQRLELCCLLKVCSPTVSSIDFE